MLLYLRTAELTVEERTFHTRLQFTIEKGQCGDSPNAVEIKAYNLTEDSRNFCELKKQGGAKRMELKAGYGGQNSVIFDGDIWYAFSERQGPDIVTTFKAMAGGLFIQHGHVELSGPYNDWDIYNHIKAELLPRYRLSQGFLSADVIAKLKSGTYPKGFTYSGSARSLLNGILINHGLDWAVDNGGLQLYSKDEYQDNVEVLLSTDTGMIGFPTKANSAASTEGDEVALEGQFGIFKAKSLLNPELICGKKIRLVSKALEMNSELRIIKLTHVGDTLEGDWYTDMELAELGTIVDGPKI
jgi:hypothetical protein